MAPDSDIYALKAMDQSGNGYLSDVIEAIDWSIENNLDVINMSMETTQNLTSLETAVNTAFENGILVVASTGNGATSSVSYPAKYNSVIAVGAIDETNNLAFFSNYGSEVEVTAPGANILSTSALGDYEYMSGTSMAAPFVAGQLALLIELYPTYTAVQIRNELHNNVLDLGEIGKDNLYGFGLIQAPVKPGVIDEEEMNTLSTPTGFRVANNKGNKIILTWNSVIDASYYHILKDNVVVYSGPDLTFRDSKLDHKKTYVYTIVAGNELGISEPTSILVQGKMR